MAGAAGWSRRGDSNPRPATYEAAALPAELRRREPRFYRPLFGGAADSGGLLASAGVGRHEVVELGESELEQIKPLLVDLHLDEQEFYPEHPHLDRSELETSLPPVRGSFIGQNLVLAVRDAYGGVAGFCWLVLFDPGTGLEGEVAEVFVASAHRGRGVGEALLERALRVFAERGVTLGYVWTRAENADATRLYRKAGFGPTKQLILTWYPNGEPPDAEG